MPRGIREITCLLHGELTVYQIVLEAYVHAKQIVTINITIN